MKNEDLRILGMKAALPKIEELSKDLLLLAIEQRVPTYAVILQNDDVKKHPAVQELNLEMIKNLKEGEAFAVCIVHIGKGSQDLLDCLRRIAIEYDRSAVVLQSDGTIILNDFEGEKHKDGN